MRPGIRRFLRCVTSDVPSSRDRKKKELPLTWKQVIGFIPTSSLPQIKASVRRGMVDGPMVEEARTTGINSARRRRRGRGARKRRKDRREASRSERRAARGARLNILGRRTDRAAAERQAALERQARAEEIARLQQSALLRFQLQSSTAQAGYGYMPASGGAAPRENPDDVVQVMEFDSRGHVMYRMRRRGDVTALPHVTMRGAGSNLTDYEWQMRQHQRRP